MSDPTRRTVLGGLAAGLLATGGCLDVVTGDEPLAFESTPASVSDDALSETGYELAERLSPAVSREVSAAGQTREVTVTNHVARYEKAIDIGPHGRQRAAVFALVTTPQAEVAGRAFNPVGKMSTRQLLEEFGSRFEGLAVDGRVGSRSESTLGTSATVEEYAGSATIQGREVDVSLYATRFEHGDDYVLALAVHPRELSGEAENVHTLVSHIQH